jgi:hypothetical protein
MDLLLAVLLGWLVGSGICEAPGALRHKGQAVGLWPLRAYSCLRGQAAFWCLGLSDRRAAIGSWLPTCGGLAVVTSALCPRAIGRPLGESFPDTSLHGLVYWL